MSDITNKTGTLGKGVYYQTKDYAGLWSRALILILDLVSLWALFIAVYFVVTISIDRNNNQIWMFVLHGCLVVSYVYLVLLKRSDIRTLGYFVTDSRIVDLNGNRPSIAVMSYRFMLLIFGPLHFFYDFLWLCNDINKQTLRDKLARTYVIHRKAEPAGHGEKTLVPFSFFLMFYQFTEVRRPKPAG